MKLQYVEISNILSIKSARLDFQQSGLVLLDGWSHDDDTANGAGKTALLNSISYGLFGKMPRKISASEILKEGSKSGFVKVGVEVGSRLFEVSRSRPTNLRFFIDGVEKNMTQEEFESHLKMNYSQYLISMYSAQTEGSKLISLNDSGKKDFFLQLMNLESIEECKKEIDALIKGQHIEKNRVETDIVEVKTRISTYEESLIDEDEVQNEVDLIPPPVKIQHRISKYSSIEKPDVDKFDSLEEKLSDKYRLIQRDEDNNASYLKDLSRIDIRIERLTNHVGDEIECPHCAKGFVPNQSSVDKDIAELIEDKKALENKILDSDELIAEKTKIKDLIIKCRNKKNSQLKEFNDAQEALWLLNGQIESNKIKMDSLIQSLKNNQVIKNKIKNNSEKLSILASSLAEIDEGIVLNETIQNIFSSTGAPAYVLDSAIDVFNDRVGFYVSLIWPNASYTLQSFRENKAGDIKAKFSEKLIIGDKERSIGALSGGEYRCLSLAVDFAVVDVLETMFDISVNPIMLDEPFVGLDVSNRERVLDLLEKIATNRQIWIIDHATEVKAMFSTVVRIEKRDGTSSIV